MKCREELNALKEEAEVLNKKLEELTEEELAQAIGGVASLAPDPLVVRALGCESGRTYLTGLDFPQT